MLLPFSAFVEALLAVFAINVCRPQHEDPSPCGCVACKDVSGLTLAQCQCCHVARAGRATPLLRDVESCADVMCQFADYHLRRQGVATALHLL